MAGTRPKARPGDAGSRRWDDKPTPSEVQEGAAYRAYQERPNNRRLHEAHAQAFNALSRAQGCRFGAWRCQNCAVFVTGRRRGQTCGNCGVVLIGLEQRAA